MNGVLSKKTLKSIEKNLEAFTSKENSLTKNKNKDNGLNKTRILKNWQKGQASLEFILVIPILILVILATSQLGYLIYTQNIMEQAAREAARIISTTNSNQKAYQEVYKICSGLDRDKIGINIVPAEKNRRKIGDIVEVYLTYQYSGFSNLLSILTGRKILVSTKSSMRMESN